jgi:Flp pilus assembly protein TadB
VTAHIVLDTYVSATPAVLDDIAALNGRQKSYQETRNAQAPETKSFTKERVDLTLTTHPVQPPIVKADQGLGTSARAALSSAAGALLYSVYLVLTGLLFLIPFAVIVWPIWAVMRRRKGAKA